MDICGAIYGGAGRSEVILILGGGEGIFFGDKK
jgi:hypothetical protein